MGEGERETPFRGSSSKRSQSDLEPVPADTVPKAGVWITVGSDKIIGESPVFLRAFETASRVAGYGDISVLISGETGTGKELVARLIHEKSERANKPFLPINCSSIAPTLAESELFGYKKGAFTGAHNERLGLFRAAEGGTVFLDEIGEMPLELQPKLLRVLEEKKVMPIGFDRELPVDVRVLAATNQKLEDRIEKGLFRCDLYERIRQVVIELPPLRERVADVPLLAEEFLRQWNEEYGETKRFTEDLLSCFTEYPWPSNVRGLQNAVSHICAISQSDLLTVELLPTDLLEYFNRNKKKTEFNLTLPEDGVDINAMIYQIKEHFFKQALNQTEANREKAATLLGLNPPAFRKALREQFDIE
jgi:transcriptional regulator with PAS, ATPase and Fis domain